MIRYAISVLMLCLLCAAPALGDRPSVQPETDAFNAVAVTDSENGSSNPPVVNTSSDITYSYTPVCISGEGITGSDYYGCGGRLQCGTSGHVYNVIAHYPNGTIQPLGQQCFEPAEEPQAEELTESDVLRAFRRVPLPESEVVVQPPGGETLVNLDTVFSTEAPSFTRTVGLLGRRVELDIWASEFTWRQGDGTVQVTDWAGRPWRKGADLAELITHRYDDAGRGLDVRVDTTWSARYRVDGGPWRDVPGTVTITGDPFDLTVLSAEPHLTG